MDRSQLKPTEQRFFDLLCDGKVHTFIEFRELLWDELSGDGTIINHVKNLRKALRKSGLDVIGRFKTFQLVRLLSSPYDGKS